MRRPGIGLGFELGVNINAEGEGGGGGTFSTSFSDISTGLFGTDASATGTGTERTDVTQTEQLKIDREGILALIEDALSGTSGLAEIFGQEAGAGLFGGSVARQGTESLLAKIAGELAKVTGIKTATNLGVKETVSEQESESEGLVDKLSGGLSNVKETIKEDPTSIITGSNLGFLGLESATDEIRSWF